MEIKNIFRSIRYFIAAFAGFFLFSAEAAEASFLPPGQVVKTIKGEWKFRYAEPAELSVPEIKFYAGVNDLYFFLDRAFWPDEFLGAAISLTDIPHFRCSRLRHEENTRLWFANKESIPFEPINCIRTFLQEEPLYGTEAENYTMGKKLFHLMIESYPVAITQGNYILKIDYQNKKDLEKFRQAALQHYSRLSQGKNGSKNCGGDICALPPSLIPVLEPDFNWLEDSPLPESGGWLEKKR